MMELVIGGSGSGKSRYAEGLAAAGPSPRVYVATMIPWDGEGRERVKKHRAMRQGRGFFTAEHYGSLDELEIEPFKNLPEGGGAAAGPGAFGGTILLECVSNLTANEFYSRRHERERLRFSAALEKNPGGDSPADGNDEERMAAARWCKDLAAGISGEVLRLHKCCGLLVAVTGNVFDDGESYGGETMLYLDILARVNRYLAAEAGRVTEVVCGIPVTLENGRQEES